MSAPSQAGASTFGRVLGAAFDGLPAPIRDLHAPRTVLHTSGTAEIDAATGLLARLVMALLGLPRPGRDVPVEVLFEPLPGARQAWRRRFGDRRYASIVWPHEADGAGLLAERLGVFTLIYRLEVEPRGLVWRGRSCRILGMPAPDWLMPRILCIESADGGRFTFDIDVTMPLIGWLIRYRGWLCERCQA